MGEQATSSPEASQDVIIDLTTPESDAVKPAHSEQRLDHEGIEAVVDDVVATLNSPKIPTAEDRRQLAITEYVRHPDATKDQKQLAELLIDARGMRDIWAELNRAKNLNSTPDHADKLVVSDYKCRLTTWVNSHLGAIGVSQLESYLEQASNDRAWAHAYTNGIAGEIALVRALRQQPNMRTVEFATPELDLRGIDIVATKNGYGAEGNIVFGIDVKTRDGNLRPEEEFVDNGNQMTHNGRVRRLEIGVLRSQITERFTLEQSVARLRAHQINDSVIDFLPSLV